MTAWLVERRHAASEAAAALPTPTISEEHWRYTNLRSIDFASYPLVAAPAGKGAVVGTIFRSGQESGTLVQRDGAVVAEQLSDEAKAQGVIFTSLERAAEEHAALVERHLGTIVGTGEKFAAANAALWSGGAFVYVPAGVTLAAPLHATFAIATAGSQQQWRVLVIAEEGAQVTFVEEHAPGVAGYANGVAELVVGAAARVEYVTVQNRDRDALHFATHRAEVGRDATLEWVAVALGGRTGKSRLESRLAGQGSTVRLTGTTIVDGTQHVDLDTTQEHDAPHATSDLFFKGVLRDRGRTVWRGVIRVAEDAQKTDAYQQNRSLILSEKAHADSIPGLEIKANDVRCTHGATIGRVDQELLYYLMSRGLDRTSAELVIVQGFFADVLGRIGSAEVRAGIETALQARLA